MPLLTHSSFASLQIQYRGDRSGSLGVDRFTDQALLPGPPREMDDDALDAALDDLADFDADEEDDGGDSSTDVGTVEVM